ncbi:mitochondrial ribosomal protein L1 [Calliopsis andreniformis]|uniref:mitochondrial ribosomal protein L1 n=1 Tax=Calliopsis andreniformis TaxID=337506 RepID=UPI003FCDED9C
MSTGWLINSFRSTYNHVTGHNVPSSLFMQIRNYAARKGTREKAKKKKVKIVVQKVGFIPHDQRADKKANVIRKISPIHTIDDSYKEKALDNVWIVKYHQCPVYSFKEAIECHRETHHPTMYNKPNAHVQACFDLNMQREKKTKFLEKFTRIVETPHPFQYHDDRTILAFCKKREDQFEAKESGASFTGGVELIKQIQAGDFPHREYDYVIAHTDILADLLLIRGLLKKRFPNVKTGNLGTDMKKLVAKFKQGIVYKAEPLSDFKEFGLINATFGTLNMDIKHLEENFVALLNDVQSMKPRKDGDFILRVQIQSPPSPELLKLDFKEYFSDENSEMEEDEEDSSAVIASH